MKPIVTGRAYDVDIPMGHGRFLSLQAQYLYSLLWDPWILNRTRNIPNLRLPGESIDQPESAVLFDAHPVPLEEVDSVCRVLDAGGQAILNFPDLVLFERLPQLKRAGKPSRLVSLRERWKFITAERTYCYADRAPFYRLDIHLAKVLSWIGDNPDLILLDNLALFAGDPMGVIVDYRNTPVFSQLLLDFAALLFRFLTELSGILFSSMEAKGLADTSDLRRDFHAFGFAYMSVLELDRCLNAHVIEPDSAAQTAIQAADALVRGGDAVRSIQLLTSAFTLLEQENRKLQPVPAVFTDTIHGGGLFADVGYCEFDWPQHLADVLANHLHWARTRSYRFNIDVAAESIRNMADRFPRLLQELREAQAQGLVEFVNGTINQPYPPFYPLESIIRQFDRGGLIFEDTMGRRPVTYASQEFGFAPQFPAILVQQGYRHAVLRVQNMGDAPTSTEEFITWKAPNGDGILSLPSHPYKSEQHNEVTYNNLHLKIYAHLQTGLDFAVFSGLGDISYYRPFREELARVSHYAPVFGRFYTWSEYFARPKKQNYLAQCFTMEDFDCQAGFLELPKWSAHQTVTGNYNSHLTLATADAYLFAATEMLESFAEGVSHASANGQKDWNWDDLLIYQGHDSYIAPFFQAGGFLGGVTTQAARDAGCGAQMVAEYLGPWDFRSILHRTEVPLAESERQARQAIRQKIRQVILPQPDADQIAVYNFGPERHTVIEIKNAAGSFLTIDGRSIKTQNVGKHLLAFVHLPAYGLLRIEQSFSPPFTSDAMDPPRIRIEEGILENDLLRAEFDLATGTMRTLIRKSDNHPLLSEGHRFSTPGSTDQRCTRVRVLQEGPLRAAVEFTIQTNGPEKGGCKVRSTVSLDIDQPQVEFHVRILRCPAFKGDQWTNHLGVVFAVADPDFELFRSHYNVLEPAHLEHIFSPNLLLARTAQTDLCFINHGNQFYCRQGQRIANILIYENEPGRHFAYAIGFSPGNPLRQARASVVPYFVEKIPQSPRAQKGSHPRSPSSVSFFSTSSPHVEILSCRKVGDRYRLRLANLLNQPLPIALRAHRRVREAFLTDLQGELLERLTVSEGNVLLTLRAWDIRQVCIALDPSEF